MTEQYPTDGYPDDLSQLSVDDDDDVEEQDRSNNTDTAGGGEQPQPEPRNEPEPEPLVEPDDSTVTEVPTTHPDKVGLAEDGLTSNETITIVGMTVMSFTLAYGVLFQMTAHGIHHAPILLWFVFAFLVLLPVGILYGMGVLHMLLGQALSVRNDTTEEHDE